jgi:predicted glycogen debranching enzyme
MNSPSSDAWLYAEWLEADGLGGFASGTVGGARTRRYHAMLLSATTPPTGRMVLVAGLEVWLETGAGSFALSSQRYAPDVTHPDGHSRIVDFGSEPWPTWTFRTADGILISQEILACHRRGEVVLRWRLLSLPGPARLMVRPLLAGRDYHSLHHENDGFDFAAEVTGPRVLWRPYPGVPAISAMADGSYRQDPAWYRNFQYDAERERGLDFTEDLASPGVFSWTLNGQAASLMLAAGEADPAVDAACLIDLEARRRKGFATPLERAADAYVVQRGSGKTIVAGYPWFTDWGRDTFIALRGFLSRPPATSCSPGLAPYRRACCPTASPIPARRPSSTRSTPRSGTSSRSTIFSSSTGTSTRPRSRPCWTRSSRSSRAIATARATASRWIRTACSRPGCRACS